MEKKNDKKLTRKENSLQVIKFIIFSVSAGVIQTISFTVINELTTWKYTPCYLIALTGAGFNEYIVLFGTMAVNLTS